MNFSQDKTESLVQAAKRYFGPIREKSVQGISEETLYHVFYHGINEKS